MKIFQDSEDLENAGYISGLKFIVAQRLQEVEREPHGHAVADELEGEHG